MCEVITRRGCAVIVLSLCVCNCIFCQLFTRILWLLVLLGFCTLFAYLVTSKLMYLVSHPKNVDVTVEYKHALQFPAVTICNHNMLR